MKKSLFLINLIIFSFLISFCVFAEETEGASTEQTTEDTQTILYREPDEIRGVLISPVEDFSYTLGESEETVKAQIDTIISDTVNYGLNTIYLNLQTREGVIYISDYYPVYTSFDALQYFIDKAKENEIYIYGIINPCSVKADDILYNYGYINSEILTQSQKNLYEVVSKYNLDAVLIEGYYNSITEDSFEQYKSYSAGMGFEQWVKESVTSLVKSLSDTVEKANPSTQFGLVCDSVWANNTTVETGSETGEEFEMYTDGYVDLPTVFTIADVNTVLVKLPGSITNSTAPFKSTLSWWKNTAGQYETKVCALIYNNKLESSEQGWASPDQVLQQLIASRDVDCKGVAFASYKELQANKGNHTDLITKFYNDQIKVSDILTTLTVSRPEKLTYSTYEPQVSFYGASDPNFPLLLNGQEVERNDKGVFSLEIELAAGENVFEFTHKTKTVTYRITRNIKIIQSVAPEGSMTVEGDSIVKISVYAYKDSQITANVAGLSIPLIASGNEDDSTDKDSGYILYTGNYQCPPSASSVQEIGNIQITGIWQGITQYATGANIRVTALPPPEIVPGEVGNLVEVTASQARTYPASVLNADPSGDCFPLPQGSRDFIASDLLSFTSGGQTYNYYILRSGIRVNAADVKVIGQTELVANNITEASVYSEGGYTYLKLKQDQPMAYYAYLPNLGFDMENGISSFNSTSFNITFKQVASIPAISLSENNIFSSASITQNGTDAVVTLNFHRAGRFAGYRAYYENGYLIFRFTNTPSSLAGARIYIDPGHGGYDSGAIPIAGMKNEAQINKEIAAKVASILTSKGASVQVTDTTNYVSLSSRVAMAQSYSPHMFVSIHQNSATTPTAAGSECWFFNPYSEIFADTMSQYVASSLGTSDRGEKYGWYAVTTHMEFPAVLMECGFLSNVNEYDKLKDDSYQNAIANAIATSIEKAFTLK